ncbi:MAG: fumarate/nitrate reduction transcriptional regulator Fnr [bacterium]|nr:fumarate/nitrate reduction transcriptional regulator Fnr [Gammaproteobacteria bacterium]
MLNDVSCAQCGLSDLCIPHSLTDEEIIELDETIMRKKPMGRGAALYRQGDRFSSLYAVRSGAVKVYSTDQEGNEQVLAFYLPGEILGMDAIDSKMHASTAKVLETSAICEIPYGSVENLSRLIPNLQVHLYRLLSREIRMDQILQLLLAKNTAEERMSAFLMNLSVRYSQRRLSGTSFNLPMTRIDVANFLGLAVETVSRVLSRMQNRGIIKVKGRDLTIVDKQALCEMAHLRGSDKASTH